MAENDGRYGEYFAARMALRAIGNVVVFTRSEAGAPHGKTYEYPTKLWHDQSDQSSLEWTCRLQALTKPS